MSEPLRQLGVTFLWLSLLQFGGTNAVVPEMHRQAVDVFHWMDARTFANASSALPSRLAKLDMAAAVAPGVVQVQTTFI